ncbi:hypothetical protein [Streptomyces griseus]
MTAIRLFFPLATLGAGALLAALATHDIPRITGTVALIVSIAALGLAILH